MKNKYRLTLIVDLQDDREVTDEVFHNLGLDDVDEAMEHLLNLVEHDEDFIQGSYKIEKIT